jgi:hypothetical protein
MGGKGKDGTLVIEKGNFDISDYTSEDAADYYFENLEEFDFDRMKPDCACIYYGIRRSGKSFLARYIAYRMREQYPLVLVFTKTKMNGFWQKFVPENYIHEGYKPAVLREFLRMQAESVRKYGKCPANQAVVYFDDIISDAEVFDDEYIGSLFSEGRHYNTSVNMITQHPKAISPVMRTNADYAFLFKINADQHLDSLVKDYLSFVPKKTAKRFISKYTSNKHCLVVSTTTDSNNPFKNISYCLGEETPQFRLGCEELWAQVDRDRHEERLEELKDLIRAQQRKAEREAKVKQSQTHIQNAVIRLLNKK